MIRDFFLLAFRNIKHRKLRSWLTVIGIIIGIGAIVALLSLSQGLEDSIQVQFEKMGGNKIFIMPKTGFIGAPVQGLTSDDVDTIENVAGVDWVLPFLYVQGTKVEYKKKEIYTSVMGIETKDLDKKWADMDINLVEGSLFNEDSYEVGLAYNVWDDDLFDTTLRVGEKVTIKDQDFKIKGLIEEIGNSQDDSVVYMPLDVTRTLFDRKTEVSVIQVQVKEGLDIDDVAARIKKRLKSSRDDENFEVMTPEQTLKIFQNILQILTFILGGIAAISLLVGGIGIMNSMYTNVLERTREIGVMKSIGARNFAILGIFITEAGLIGFFGGLVGVGFGFLIAKMVEVFADVAGFGMLIIKPNIGIFMVGLGFAVIVSILAGFFPARQASRLKPVDALRY